MLYNGYVRGFLLYGCATWGSYPALRNIIEIVDRSGMKMCCGAIPTFTKIDNMLEESTLKPILDEVDKLRLKTIARFATWKCFIPFALSSVKTDSAVTKMTPLESIVSLWEKTNMPGWML